MVLGFPEVITDTVKQIEIENQAEPVLRFFQISDLHEQHRFHHRNSQEFVQSWDYFVGHTLTLMGRKDYTRFINGSVAI